MTTDGTSFTTIRVSEVMTPHLLTVTTETPFAELCHRLLERGVSAVPVLNEDGAPIGIVSKTDLVRAEDFGRLDEPARLTAGDLMTPVAFTVPGYSTVQEAADIMARAGVHRVFVIDEKGRATGVLSSMDVVRLVAGINGPR